MTAEIEGFITYSARQRGIVPDIALRVARSEGGVDDYALRGTFATGSSWWSFQLHYGGIGYLYLGTVAGMGNGFTKLTGWLPGEEAAWKDSIRYALNRAKASGWGAWYGAAHVGVAQWEGIDTNHEWDANAETWDYERRGTRALVYNPAQPPERQVQDWTCSIRSTQWVLKSLGIEVPIGDLQDQMVPTYVTPELGLLDGSGHGLAEVLRWHLPKDWHSRVQVFERIDWGNLWERSGKGPFALGLHGAYHWINVAAPQADGSLISPNPAPKYPAAAPIGDVLTLDEMTTYGPVSAVWVDASSITTLPPDATPPPDPADPYAPWRATVGSGLLEMMEQDNTLPAQHVSTWLPLDVTPSDIEVCAGQNGIQYQWQLTTGRGFRYAPVAS